MNKSVVITTVAHIHSAPVSLICRYKTELVDCDMSVVSKFKMKIIWHYYSLGAARVYCCQAKHILGDDKLCEGEAEMMIRWRQELEDGDVE
jgi:hypothetical protein